MRSSERQRAMNNTCKGSQAKAEGAEDQVKEEESYGGGGRFGYKLGEYQSNVPAKGGPNAGESPRDIQVENNDDQ